MDSINQIYSKILNLLNLFKNKFNKCKNCVYNFSPLKLILLLNYIIIFTCLLKYIIIYNASNYNHFLIYL